VRTPQVLRLAAGLLMALLATEPLLVVDSGDQRNAVALVAILPVVLAGIALVWPRSPFGLLFGVAVTCEYALALSLADVQVDQVAPLFGLALLGTIELLDALPVGSRGRAVKVDRALRQARLARWLVAGAAALAAGALALAATSASTAGEDAFLRSLGMAAAALAIAIPVLVARRVVGSRRSRLFAEDER
jgi:hypothetical protein